MKILISIFRTVGSKNKNYLIAALLLLVSIFARTLEPKVLEVAVDSVLAPVLMEESRTHWQDPEKARNSQNRFALYIQSLLPDSNQQVAQTLLYLGFFYLLISLIRGGFLFVSSAIKHDATHKVIYQLRSRLFNHLQRLPLSYFGSMAKGELMQRATGDIDTVKDFIDQQVITLIRLSATLFFSVYLMYMISPGFTFWCICLTPLITLVSYRFFKQEKKIWALHEEEADKLNNKVQESLNGIRTLHAMGNSRHENQMFATLNQNKRKRGIEQSWLHAKYWPLTDALVNMQIILCLVAGAFWVSSARLSVGEFMAFYAYITMIAYPMRQLGKVLSNMGMAMVAMERINEVFAMPIETPNHSAPLHNVCPSIQGKIELVNVSFAYKTGKNVLNQVSFVIEPGEKIAIIGPGGSGKSTLITLLLRLYEPTRGVILLDNMPLNQYSKEVVRSNMGVNFQNAFLFSTLLRENITLAQTDYEQEDLDWALKGSEMQETIRNMPLGLETLIGEKGINLSGGQKQRVALARTYMQQAPVLILDDTTSAVDSVTERKMLQHIEQFTRNKTLIFVSQRIQTIQKADRILELKNGTVACSGDHDYMLQHSDYYQSMVAIQQNQQKHTLLNSSLT